MREKIRKYENTKIRKYENKNNKKNNKILLYFSI